MNKKEILIKIIAKQQLLVDSIIPGDIKESILLLRAKKAAKAFKVTITKLIK